VTRMGSDEAWAKCQQCGTELKQGDKVCPKCGSTKKHFERTCHAVLTLKTTAQHEHEAHWSSKSWTILGTMMAILALLLALLSPWPSFVIRIAIAITILVVALLVGFNNRMRYSLLMLLRQLDHKFTARKKYGDKKKLG